MYVWITEAWLVDYTEIVEPGWAFTWWISDFIKIESQSEGINSKLLTLFVCSVWITDAWLYSNCASPAGKLPVSEVWRPTPTFKCTVPTEVVLPTVSVYYYQRINWFKELYYKNSKTIEITFHQPQCSTLGIQFEVIHRRFESTEQ